MNEDAYKCIAQQMGVVGSYPKWEELVTGVVTHFSVPVFGGWLAPVRHAFIEAEIPDGDTIYTQILKAFEYLTSSDPLTLWPSSGTIEKAELQFRHVEDGWFEVNLKRCRTRLQTRHLPTAQNCEARVKELAQSARCLRRTKHVLSRAHLFTSAALPECIRSERQGREERDGVKKRRTYRNVISKVRTLFALLLCHATTCTLGCSDAARGAKLQSVCSCRGAGERRGCSRLDFGFEFVRKTLQRQWPETIRYRIPVLLSIRLSLILLCIVFKNM